MVCAQPHTFRRVRRLLDRSQKGVQLQLCQIRYFKDMCDRYTNQANWSQDRRDSAPVNWVNNSNIVRCCRKGDWAPLFARAILAGEPIKVFNKGEMWRDFTYIDDIVSGILAALEKPASGVPPHKVYNLGNNNSEKLTDFIATLEGALGKKAEMVFEPMQPGDVAKTYADIEETRRDLGFVPTTAMHDGVPKFVEWYRGYYGV